MRVLGALAALWAVCVVICAHATPQTQNKRVHLFILSGQSNMYYMDPNKSFTPELRKAFPDDEVIVVKDSMGGQPISMWVKITDVKEGKGKPYKPSTVLSPASERPSRTSRPPPLLSSGCRARRTRESRGTRTGLLRCTPPA